MNAKSSSEVYREFLAFVQTEMKREQALVSSRMRQVLLWCLLIPIASAMTLLILIHLRLLPFAARAYLEWVLLFFPVLYSFHFLGSNVLRDMPAAYRRGGVANLLGHAQREGDWRERVCEGLQKSVHASSEEWGWIAQSFRADLSTMIDRTRFITVLSGAVLYLIVQGIDSFSEATLHPAFIIDSGLARSADGLPPADATSWVAVALFLVLLYLSGAQAVSSLRRFLHCVELLAIKKVR